MITSRRRPPETRAREAAFAILERIDAGRGRSNALLAALPAEMDDRDRALATELVYGVLRRRRTIDDALAVVTRRPLAGVDHRLLTLLRLAAYQILCLTRIPARAAVDEAVGAARALHGAGAAGFTNGVLRGLCRALAEGQVPVRRDPHDAAAEPDSHREWLAAEFSFPRFLVDRFVERYGAEEAAALLEVMNRPAPLALRASSKETSRQELAARLDREGVGTVASPALPASLRVTRGIPQRTEAFRAGEFYIQDEASQMVSLLLLPVRRSDRLIDLCAAPGGKILTIAAQAEARPEMMLAADRSLKRLRLLRDNAARADVGDLQLLVMDAERPALAGRFNRVLLDAPCSGTGVIRRHPELRWRRKEADIGRFAEEQARALRAAVGLLAPGGRLVYAVCSLEPEEGEERVAGVLSENRSLRLVDARDVLPEPLHRFATARGHFLTLPHRDDVDGFFAAIMTLC